MNYRFVLRYSLDYFIGSIRKMLFVAILAAVSGVACMILFVLLGMTQQKKQQVSDCMSFDLMQCGLLVSVNSDFAFAQESILLHENKGVESFGISYISMAAFEDGILKSLLSEGERRRYQVVMNASVGMLDLVKNSIEKEKIEEAISEGSVPIVLGEKLKGKGVDVGTDIGFCDHTGKERRAVIVGFLEANDTWLLTSDYRLGIPDNPTTNVENACIMFYNDADLTQNEPILIHKSEEVTWEELSKEIIGDEVEGGQLLCSIKELLTGDAARTAEAKNYLRRILMLLIAVTALTMISSHTVVIVQSRKTVGIWFANGASRLDVILVVSFSSVLWVVVIALALLLMGNLLVSLLCNGSEAIYVRALLVQYAFPAVVLLQAFFFAVGTVLPLVMIRRESPSDLVKGFVE